jgi:hypothetical protein
MPAFARKNGAEYKLYGGVLPIMRLFGVTQEGHSVVAHIHGYEPYFYVQVTLHASETHLRYKCASRLGAIPAVTSFPKQVLRQRRIF